MKIRFTVMLTAIFLLGSLSVQAEARKDQLQLREGYPKEYVVEKGDTLWDISNRFLKTPWRWPDLWRMNPEISNPHLIYPGDHLKVVWVDGQPTLMLERGITRLYPKAKVTSLEQAIPAISLKDVVGFLSRNRVVSENLLSSAPYVLGGKNDRLISGAGDRVYARGTLENDDFKQAVYRVGDRYLDPKTGVFLGQELVRVADVRVFSNENDLITLDIERSDKEVRQLDRILAIESGRITSVFYPQPAPLDLEAEVLSILGGVNDGGQFNVIAINAGEREDLEPGSVMLIKRRGEYMTDPVTLEKIYLPAERSGIVMVFKVFERVSYGLIMQSDNVVSIGDMVVSP